MPIGEDNAFSPGPADRGQPTHFLPRRNRFAFEVRVPPDCGRPANSCEPSPAAGSPSGPTRPCSRDYIVDNTVVMSETGALGAGLDLERPPSFSRGQFSAPSRDQPSRR